MTVQDVVPVGFPALFDRKSAVTEPWMLNPPVIASSRSFGSGVEGSAGSSR